MEWFKFTRTDGSIEWVNLLGVLGALAILLITIFILGTYLKKIKDGKAEGEALEHDWDGIKEFKNHLPVGWALSFIGILIFFLWYIFIGYPLNTYSQIGEYNEEVRAYNTAHEAIWSNMNEGQKVQMGQDIFLVQCSQCHGVSADGQPDSNGKLRAKNLTKWGSEEGIVDVIKNGSKGLEYGMGEMTPVEISDAEARAVAAFVMAKISAVGKTKNAGLVEQGARVFAEQCSACHGDNGDGMGGMASNLQTYGTSEYLAEVLNKGKKGLLGYMPSFNYVNFAPEQVDALNAFINSLDIIE